MLESLLSLLPLPVLKALLHVTDGMLWLSQFMLEFLPELTIACGLITLYFAAKGVLFKRK